MRVHVLVEGPSDEVLLNTFFRRLLPNHRFLFYVHRGKGHLSRDPSHQPGAADLGLLDQLPTWLSTTGRWLDPKSDRVLVVVDLDDTDAGVCEQFKQRLVDLRRQVEPRTEVVFRIACEETEAFYLGDRPAVRRAFGKLKEGALRGYEQDSVDAKGTWERFKDLIDAGAEDKVRWAEGMGPELSLEYWRNASRSFVNLCRAAYRLCGEPRPQADREARRRGRAEPNKRRSG